MFALIFDLKQALRSLTKAPLFTAAAALTLGLGIGLDSAMLAVFDRLLLRPLPFEELDTLVGVYEADTKLGWTQNVVSSCPIPGGWATWPLCWCCYSLDPACCSNFSIRLLLTGPMTPSCI